MTTLLENQSKDIQNKIDKTLFYMGIFGRVNQVINYTSDFPHETIFNNQDILQLGNKNGFLNRHYQIHSESLYYSLLCSIIDNYKDEIDKIERSHSISCNSYSIPYLHELINLCHNIKNCNNYYFIRNELLDYDRIAINSNEQKFLWLNYVKISRLLLKDKNSSFGYLTLGSKTLPIWYMPSSAVNILFLPGSCEKTFIILNDKRCILTEVERKEETAEFMHAKLSFFDAPPISNPVFVFFKELTSIKEDKNNVRIQTTTKWEDYTIEAGLVSGEEMEELAFHNCIMWAIDDFKINNTDSDEKSQWLDDQTTRGMAWRKSIGVIYKGATIQRLFLVDKQSIQSHSNEAIETLVALFSSVTVQHLFFQEVDLAKNYKNLSEVRLLNKDDYFKIKERDKSFLDLALMTFEERVIGGVMVQPQAKFLHKHENHELMMMEIKKLWNLAESKGKYPYFFKDYVKILKSNKESIMSVLTKRDEIIALEKFRHSYYESISKWIDNTFKQIE